MHDGSTGREARPAETRPGGGDPTDGELARDISACAGAGAAGGGAAVAEAELCRRLGPRIRLYGLRHLRDGAAADDLVQEVLVLTLERLRAGRVREPDRVASFVLGACRLVARNLRRGVRRRQGLLDRYAAVFPRHCELDSVDLDRDRLRACLQRLAERERSVLVMTFYAERGAAEIAAAVGTSEANVRTLRHRAFGRLRDCVQGGA